MSHFPSHPKALAWKDQIQEVHLLVDMRGVSCAVEILGMIEKKNRNILIYCKPE